ncbi:M4 family metallopeptidase [Planococcus sp. 1R117A]|uniref:M4 family metallopeptidase n=1 Tax=Planococcus sp. 1R117A TaxID=3447020 RepID=UPI003EDCB20F
MRKRNRCSIGLSAALLFVASSSVYAAPDNATIEQVYVNPESEAPNFIAGSLTPSSQKGAAEIVYSYLEVKENLYGLAENESQQFKKISELKDELGMTNVKLQQMFNGIPVYGSVLSAHVSASGVLTSVSGEVVPDLTEAEALKGGAVLTAAKASAIALGSLGKLLAEPPQILGEKKPELMIFMDGKAAKLAYHLQFEFLSPEPGNYHYFIDAQTGQVIEYYNQLHKAVALSIPEGTDSVSGGTGVLGDKKKVNTVLNSTGSYLVDRTRGKGIFTYNAANLTEVPGTLWLDRDDNYHAAFDGAAVDAHVYAGMTFDYFKKVHKRNSFDGKGAALVSTVHYGKNYNNAFWSGTQMVYGDGDGKKFISLSGSLDVIAHELTHAVSQSTAGLIYWNDSGAINESMSDIFGVLVEDEYQKNPDWQIGEDIVTPDIAGDALRSLADPTANGLPDHYTKRYLGTEDFGGVHINSSITNKAAYLLANGGTHYNIKVQGIGNEKTGKIFYRTLTQYLTPTTKFRQLQASAVQAAIDLYGADSKEVKSVKDAFAAVGLK